MMKWAQWVTEEKSKKISQMNRWFYIRTRLMVVVGSKIISLVLVLDCFV